MYISCILSKSLSGFWLNKNVRVNAFLSGLWVDLHFPACYTYIVAYDIDINIYW